MSSRQIVHRQDSRVVCVNAAAGSRWPGGRRTDLHLLPHPQPRIDPGRSRGRRGLSGLRRQCHHRSGHRRRPAGGAQRRRRAQRHLAERPGRLSRRAACSKSGQAAASSTCPHLHLRTRRREICVLSDTSCAVSGRSVRFRRPETGGRLRRFRLGRRSGLSSRQHDLSNLKHTIETPCNALGQQVPTTRMRGRSGSADASAATDTTATAHSPTAPDTATASNAAATCDQFCHLLGHGRSPSSWINQR